MDAFDPKLITDGVTAATLLGLVGILIKIALGQADKRATVAEKREEVCTTTLAATLTTMTALTAEVRKSGEEGSREIRDLTRRMDDGARHLDRLDRGVREGMRELLDALKERKASP